MTKAKTKVVTKTKPAVRVMPAAAISTPSKANKGNTAIEAAVKQARKNVNVVTEMSDEEMARFVQRFQEASLPKATAITAGPTSTMHENMNQLNDMLTIINGTVRELEVALKLVLTPQPDGECGVNDESGIRHNGNAAINQYLCDQARRVEDLNGMLRSILHRLEI